MLLIDLILCLKSLLFSIPNISFIFIFTLSSTTLLYNFLVASKYLFIVIYLLDSLINSSERFLILLNLSSMQRTNGSINDSKKFLFAFFDEEFFGKN